MALKLNKIEVLPEGLVQVRYINTETGEYHREVLTPDDDSRAGAIGGRVHAVAQAIWTPETKEQWGELKKEREKEREKIK